jgi:hypothetical protein
MSLDDSRIWFDTQRHHCMACGGPLTHPTHGRPRRYCDADCAADGKRTTEARLMTPERLEAMRQTSRRIRARKAASRLALRKAGPDAASDTVSRYNAHRSQP